MKIRQWLGNKLFGIDKVVDMMVSQRLNVGSENIKDIRLAQYRMNEYKTWAQSNPNALLEFYKLNVEPSLSANRHVFWQWVGGINVPKLHYPASEALMNHMKSLLFDGDLDIQFVSDKESEEQEVTDLNKRMSVLLEDINFYDLMHNASNMATYSGTIAAKFVIDKEIHDKPIVQIYPRERIELLTKHSKVITIVFKDFYRVDDKEFTLRSYYGKGYIDYKLFNDKEKEVALSNVPELVEYKRQEFNEKIMMACYMKNRTTSNEFPDLPYGGSDFEGITDLFHSIDEVFSLHLLYLRRSRPMMSVTDDLLPASADGSKKIMPKEWELDIVQLKASDSARDRESKLHRDVPELNIKPYTETINSLMKAIYQKIGMSYTSVGLDDVSADISGAALVQKERPTIIVRNNKIKLFRQFAKEFLKLLLIYDDLLNSKKIINLYDKHNLQVDFPEYNAQSFEDKVEELSKAVVADLIDIETGVDRLLGNEYTVEEIRKIVRNIKIENSIPLLQDQLEDEE